MPEETAADMTVAEQPTITVQLAAEPSVLVQQAMALFAADNHEASAALARQALLADPGNADALHVLGLTHLAMQAPSEAIKLLDRSVAIERHALVLHNLGMAQQSVGQLSEAAANFRSVLRLDPTFLAAWANLIFALDLHPGAPPELLLAERRRFNDTVCAPLTRQAPPHQNTLDPERRLNIGYVSGDFRQHSASQSFAPVIANHDEKRFKVHLYSTCSPAKFDGVTAFFRERAHVWCEAQDVDDEQLAEAIRNDGIDVLVDLSGYSRDGRLLTFARKPAPIQITGWGYATGTGLDAMDFLVSDAIAIPPTHEDRYTERIMRLPCLVAYEAGTNVPDVNPEPPCSRNGYTTFGYLGRPHKINDGVLAVWATILRQVPGSKLLLKADEFRMTEWRERVMDPLVGLGVDVSRVLMRTTTDKRDHLAAHNDVDVMLDTFPAGAGATALDTCLMGVPTVTMLGEHVPSRQCASIIACVGLNDAGSTVGSYVEQAIGWSQDVERLAIWRRTLRQKLQASAIMDGPRYAAAFERRVRDAWRLWTRRQRMAA